MTHSTSGIRKPAQSAPMTALLVNLLLPYPAVAASGGLSCTQATTLASGMSFATSAEQRKELGKRDAWARQLSAFDRGVRLKNASPTTLDQFLDFAAVNAVPWTAQERAAWQPIVDKLSTAMAGFDLHVPQISLVKTTGHEELDAAAYKRQ